MLSSVITPVFATDQFTSLIGDLDTEAKKPGDQQTQQSLVKIGGDILAFIRNLSIILAMIILSILGVKYMLGSAEEKASYKKTLIPLVVGIIVVMAASTLVSMIYGFANNF
jgi:type IV secretory pathway VirB2 component (pilin)